MIADFLIVIALGMAGGGGLALGLRRLSPRRAPRPRRSGPPNQGSAGRPPTSVNFVIVERLVPR